MDLIEESGDLFDLDLTQYVVAHCISADVTPKFGLNAGIAKTFRQTYPRLAATISPSIRIGKAIRYTSPTGHVIYNLVTKPTIRHKCIGSYKVPYMTNLQRCLIDLRDSMLNHHEIHLAMPRIAAGLDRAEWRVVRDLVTTIFKDTPIRIIIRYLP